MKPPDRQELTSDRHRVLRAVVMNEIARPKPVRFRRLRTVPVTALILVVFGASTATALLLRSEFNEAAIVLPAGRAEAIQRLGGDIPLPPEGSFDVLVDLDMTEDEEGLAFSLAFHAWCLWAGSWLDGFHGGDPTTSDRAARVMAEVPGWSQVRAVDPRGDLRAGLGAVAAAAVAGDGRTVAAHYKINCTTVDPDRDDMLAIEWPGLPTGSFD